MTDTITKEQVREEYRTYPDVLEDGLPEKPWYLNRMLPVLLEIPKGSKVLDVGCNAGDFMELIKRERGCDVTGVDLSEICIEKAKAKGLNVHLVDAETLPFPDQSFDCVILTEVLSHLYDPVPVLNEIVRVLKPRGILLGSTPHQNLETYLWEEKRFHRRYYDETELEVELNKHFYVSHIRTLNGAQFAMSMATSFLGEKPVEILFKCGPKGTLGWDSALQDKSILRVWFGFTQPPGDVYYRMSGYADKMGEMGAEIAYNPYRPEVFNSTSDWQSRIRGKLVLNQLESLLKSADLSVWQITQSQDVVAFLWCAKDLLKKPILAECDDWLFDLPASNLASNPYKPNSEAEKIAFKQLELSDGIIVSTQFLKESFKELFPGKPIYVIKNSIDFGIWDHITPTETIPKKADGVVRIGYTGCGNHSGDLELVKKPLLALLEEYPNLEVILPMPFDSWKDVKHERVFFVNKWVSLPEFPGMVKGWDLDIGMAPLRDNNFNCAKSNLRWLEYSALGLPSVVSRVRPFEESIDHGSTGYLANSPKHFYRYFKALINDKSLRAEVGGNAYRHVKKHFNMDKVAKDYMRVLKEIKHDFK